MDIGDLKFRKGVHKYDVWDGKKWRSSVPSVSKIKGQLDKPALMFWAANITAEYCVKEVMPLVASGKLQLAPDDYETLYQKARKWSQEKSKEATDIGTEVHNAILEYTIRKTKPSGLSDVAQLSFDAYLKWEKEIHLGKVMATEKPFYNEEFDFCGTFDKLRYIYLPEKLYLIDYKTSKGFYDIDMALQLAGYKIGAEGLIEQGKIPDVAPGTTIDGIGILRLDKETGTPQFKDYTPWLPFATPMFLLLRDFLELTEKFNKISGLEI